MPGRQSTRGISMSDDEESIGSMSPGVDDDDFEDDIEFEDDESNAGSGSDSDDGDDSPELAPAEMAHPVKLKVGNCRGHPVVTVKPYTRSGPAGVTTVVSYAAGGKPDAGLKQDDIKLYNPPAEYVLVSHGEGKLNRGLLARTAEGMNVSEVKRGVNVHVLMVKPNDDRMRVTQLLRKGGIQVVTAKAHAAKPDANSTPKHVVWESIVAAAADPAKAESFRKDHPEATAELDTDKPWVGWNTVEDYRRKNARKPAAAPAAASAKPAAKPKPAPKPTSKPAPKQVFKAPSKAPPPRPQSKASARSGAKPKPPATASKEPSQPPAPAPSPTPKRKAPPAEPAKEARPAKRRATVDTITVSFECPVVRMVAVMDAVNGAL